MRGSGLAPELASSSTLSFGGPVVRRSLANQRVCCQPEHEVSRDHGEIMEKRHSIKNYLCLGLSHTFLLLVYFL